TWHGKDIVEEYEPKAKFEKNLDEAIDEHALQFLNDAKKTKQAEGRTRADKEFAKMANITKQNWWAVEPRQKVFHGPGKVRGVGIEEIYKRALRHSAQIQVFSDLPLIRETAIGEARGQFDTELYGFSRYDRTDEPVGSTLETGMPGFFRETGWTSEVGLRKKFLPGTRVSIAQEFSQISNNSQFFVPGNQGLSRLKLTVMQPLLRGAGVTYNRSLIQIAKLDAQAGYAEFVRQVETHLMELNRSYWSLYLSRAALGEKRRLVKQTAEVVEQIESRANLDADSSQLFRARSALASRKADVVRAELAVKNIDSRLRSLVNDPELLEASELVPRNLPITTKVSSDFGQAIADALQFRPETKQAEAQLRAAAIREKMMKNEKRIELNVVGEVGISALRSGGNWQGAYGDQYRDGSPTWGLGVIGSVPLERRFAKARLLRAKLEKRQQKAQLRSTMDTVLLEVQIAHREVVTAYPDMRAKWDAALAAGKDLEVLLKRRSVDADGKEDVSTSLYLERVLDSQLRRSMARETFLESQAIYNSSLTNLERAKGTLLESEMVDIQRDYDNEQDLPEINLIKDAAAKSAKAIYESVK
ncbi:MAG: TolC family protein, partial [Verrucomicrobia bacterium]|nr:TolC family protein [Verrucomicrobiota bacterium]